MKTLNRNLVCSHTFLHSFCSLSKYLLSVYSMFFECILTVLSAGNVEVNGRADFHL